MMIGRLLLAVMLVFPFAASAQKRQIQELQRDMALLQDEIRTVNSGLTNLTVLVEQLTDKVNNTNTTVTVLDSHLKDSLKEQESQIATPVATVGAKVDQMSQEFRFVKESIADLNSRVGQLQAQIGDLKTSMRIMAAPPPPPAGGAPAGSAAAPAPVGSMDSATKLYNDALRDQSGGKLDLALMEFQDFLRLHPNSDLAPAAQFGVGEVYFAKGDYQAASESFDLLLEKYPENEKTPDSMFMKAKSLAGLDQKRSAAREYRALIKKYPNAALSQRAQEELAALGY